MGSQPTMKARNDVAQEALLRHFFSRREEG